MGLLSHRRVRLLALLLAAVVLASTPNCPSKSPYRSDRSNRLQSQMLRGVAEVMGSMWKRWFERRILTNVVMLGLDAAGKTAVLYKLRLGTTPQTIPTMGFNTEAIAYKNYEFRIWDVGGQDRIRTLWDYHLDGARVVIFVVDSADRARLPKARMELHRLMKDERLKQAHLLVYANKQDQANAISAKNLATQLNLEAIRNRSWYLQGSCARTGEGLYEGLDWLVSELRASDEPT
ncbi:hypothetical protein AAMO2058_000029300 [Amorphochlora amoebiformis]